MSGSADWRLVNVRLPLVDERNLFRLEIRDGRWTGVEKQPEYLRTADAVSLDSWSSEERRGMPGHSLLDAEGKMLLPGLADAHMHLDKAFSLPVVENVSGTLQEACRNYASAFSSFSKSEIKARIMRAALQSLSCGTTHLRTHLDFHSGTNPQLAISTVEAALEVREALSSYMTIQLVPMIPARLRPQELELVEEALRMGVDGIGGAPHMSEEPEEHIRSLFELGSKHGCFLDLHADETDNPDVRTVGYIAQCAKRYGKTGQVTVGHLCSLASMTEAEADRLMERMLEAGLNVVSLPAANLYLQGRGDDFPVRRGVTRIKQLWEKGIPVAVASDNIHDPFHPFGKGDLVQIGLISSYAAHMGRPADLRILLRMISDIPAVILGISDYGVKTGSTANFVILDCGSPEELFTMLPERRWVFSGGKWIRLASPKSDWKDAALSAHWNQARDAVSF